jgi:hypothetical protein
MSFHRRINIAAAVVILGGLSLIAPEKAHANTSDSCAGAWCTNAICGGGYCGFGCSQSCGVNCTTQGGVSYPFSNTCTAWYEE